MIFPLKHAKAPALFLALSQLAGRESAETRPQFVQEGRTNSIIVYATRQQIALIRTLIEELDVETADDESKDVTMQMRTRMQVMIFEVDLMRDRLNDVTVKDLTARAESPESLSKALAKLGDARVLYRVDQILDSERKSRKTVFGASAPFVKSSSTSKDGTRAASIKYEDIGFIVEASGAAISDAIGSAQLEIEFKGVADSDIDIGSDVKAPVIRNFEQSFRGPFESGKPIVLFLVDAHGDSGPVAYVTRIQFDIEPL
ncbi:MAG: hypothetical protein H6818_17505 [Phycisphaerales bacterium]|nr:hypothetical protein [Phycisphaerales bacterium]MCB9864574.1 hypothetical protein [Phycisphaerales bacterium]